MLNAFEDGGHLNVSTHVHIIGYFAVAAIIFTHIGKKQESFQEHTPVPFEMEWLSASSADTCRLQGNDSSQFIRFFNINGICVLKVTPVTHSPWFIKYCPSNNSGFQSLLT